MIPGLMCAFQAPICTGSLATVATFVTSASLPFSEQARSGQVTINKINANKNLHYYIYTRIFALQYEIQLAG